MAAHLLIIEDTATMAALYANYLSIAGCTADIAEDGNRGMMLLSQKAYSAIILDLHLPDMNGIDILKHIRTYYEDTPVIVVTAYGSINVAVDSMKQGAYDFIMKPFPASRLNTTVQNALENRKMRRELKELRRSVHQDNYGKFIGSSPAMQALFRQIEAVASSRASIFISGESGTGKELVAQSLHRASPRAPRPFVALNCAAIPAELLESEIFGHVKGAFTGAANDRQGAAKWADGGTLFLDEICEMPMELQAKLLRFVQTGAYTPVGGSKPERSDIRFICATNRDATAQVEAGRMREDLYYRLHVVPIEAPPLRDREDDVVELSEAFLKQFAAEENKKFTGIDPAVMAVFRNCDWPGNVRQLQNVIRQMVLMNDGQALTLEMLPEKLLPRPPMEKGANVENFTVKPLWQLEKETILRTLRVCKDDVGRAAAMLEVSPSTIYRKLQAWRGNEAIEPVREEMIVA